MATRKKNSTPRKTTTTKKGLVPGRDTLLSEDLITEMAAIVAEGNTFKTAFTFTGIDEPTFHRWKAEGKALAASGMSPRELNPNQKLYLKFYEAITRARATAARKHNASIAKFSANDWRASAWWLERNFPDQYGPKARVDVDQNVTVSEHKTLEVKHVIDSEEKATMIMQALRDLLPDNKAIDVEEN